MSGPLDGNTVHPLQDHPTDTSTLIQALEAIYDPRISNEDRKTATILLEDAKTQIGAPSLGYSLASDRTRPHIVRHYGISLLDYPVRYAWTDCNEEQAMMLRDWAVELALNACDEDSVFLRNKIAQLWVELAKHCWPGQWQNMDEVLCDLWGKSLAHQGIVLHILETLFEETFSKDDHGLALRGANVLGKACVIIFSPSRSLIEQFPNRDVDLSIAHGEEGWLQRLLNRLQWCLSTGVDTNPQARDLAIKLLEVIKTVMPWLPPKGIASTNCIDLLCTTLMSQDTAVKLATVDSFHALYHRPQLRDDEVAALVCPLLTSRGIDLLRTTFQGAQVDVGDIDAEKYTLLKKLSETTCALASFLEQRPRLLASADIDFPGLLDFLIGILQNGSLNVSIPVLYIWTKLLSIPAVSNRDGIQQRIGNLLEICSERHLRYEALSPDSNDPTFLFLVEDFDTIPERHAFVGNYRRYCVEVIERIVRKAPFEAMQHILGQADNLVRSLHENTAIAHGTSVLSSSPLLLRVDSQATVVVIALKGYLNWIKHQDEKSEQYRSEHEDMQAKLEMWCKDLLQNEFKNAVVQKRLLTLVNDIAMIALRANSSVPLAICEHVFKRTAQATGIQADNEGQRELESAQPRELQKLAMRFPDALLSVYGELQQSIDATCNSSLVDGRTKLDYRAFLFIIVHRSTVLDDEIRNARLNELLEPTLRQWENRAFQDSLTSFESFCELLGLREIPEFLLSSKVHTIEDWSTMPLNAHGQQLRESILTRSDTLPLQATRSLLSASTDRIKPGSREYKLAKARWQHAIPIIIPSLLHLVSYAHSFSNPARWSGFPVEMQAIIKRTLLDRVWQSGISSESRDDFYNRVRDSKATLEGLGSTVRGAVRGVRELSYWILHCMSQFGEAFYSIKDLPGPLAQALYEDAHELSAHQVSTLLRLSSALIEGCPPELRASFLPSLLTSLFRQLDAKIVAEWEAIEKEKQDNITGGNLDHEMKTESVLRQLTYSAVMLVSSLLDSKRLGELVLLDIVI